MRRAGDRSAGLAAGLAAVLPAAAILVWRSVPLPIADPTGADCTNLLAPPAVWRFFEGAIGLVVVLGLVLDRRATLGEVGLRRGSRGVRAVAFASFLVILPLAMSFASLVGGSAFGGMFFGSYILDTSQPAALLPALVFAGSNSLAEELASQILNACVEAGGSLTGEHGIGLDKARHMGKMFSEADLDAMNRLRCGFDPDGRGHSEYRLDSGRRQLRPYRS